MPVSPFLPRANWLRRHAPGARDGRLLGLASNKNDYQLVNVPNWLPELKQRLAREP
jgi:hypothetical protein